jgi:alanine dehydrogenase
LPLLDSQEVAIWLNEADVRAVLPVRDVIGAMEAALAAFSGGQVRQPVRTVIEAGLEGAFFATMPAFLECPVAVMGAKLVTVFHQNTHTGLPTHQAAIVLLDAGNGSLLAVMDGRYITEIRTAAVSALAVRTLSRTGARKLAIIGSGVQAGSHLEALPLVRRFDEVSCWSPTAARLLAFADRHPGVDIAASAEAAVSGADVVVLATSSRTPVIRGEWVEPGACVVSVGACRPDQREMDPDLVSRGRLFVDSRASALRESGDVVMGIAEGRFAADHIAAELGDVLNGREQGRTREEEVTVFKALGLAVEDVAAAHLSYTRAHAMGRGVTLA